VGAVITNHKRPHQGIGGLFPADRYFQIRPIEKNDWNKDRGQCAGDGVEGEAERSLYMVGRMKDSRWYYELRKESCG